MSRSITDARQITLRQFLQQITNASTYAGTADSKPANQAELDNLLAALNAEVTPLLRMSASSTPNLVVTVGAAILANPESSYTRSIPHIGALLPNNFTSGTVTFPASSGGTITVSPGNNGVLTVSSGNFIKVLVYMDTSGNLNVLSGTENASESAATVPKAPIDTLPLGYVTLQNTAGVIQNIAQNKIYQFYTGSGVTQTALDSEFVIKDVTDPTKQIGFDAAGTTNTKTTIAGSQTANRTLTLPDITDFLVTRTNAESLSNKVIAFSAANDNTSGSNITLASFNSGVIRLTNASLVSVSGLPAGTSGQLVIVENKTGAQVFINNEEVTATAANRILTGTNGSVPMPNNATFIFTYDATSSRWQLTGGSGSGTGSGGVNFITNGTADAGTTGWVTYADASASRPVDGTGGHELEAATEAATKAIERVAREGDVVVLGCTHYVMLKDSLRERFQNSFTIVSQDEVIPKKLADYLERHEEIASRLSNTGKRQIQLTLHRPDYDRLTAEFLGGVYLPEE